MTNELALILPTFPTQNRQKGGIITSLITGFISLAYKGISSFLHHKRQKALHKAVNAIAYASKRLPKAARNYSITELEMCGLAINIASFAHLLKKVDFDAIVDHLALVHILKSKTEPATPRIKRLLDVLSAYSFNLYYMKGKDMILSDFLSRQEIDKSDPHEIIPISLT